MRARGSGAPRWPERPRTARVGCAALLLALALGRLHGATGVATAGGTLPVAVNPCTGEAISLREPVRFLPHLSPVEGGSRQASVNAVGVRGTGSRGTDYLPLGTSKLVLTVADGTLEVALGSDLELIGRGSGGQDFLFRGLARFKLSLADGLGGSGIALHARCE